MSIEMFTNLKKMLKRNPLLYEINARLKEARRTRQSRQTALHYAKLFADSNITYSEELIRSMILNRMKSHGTLLISVPKGKMRIFCVGTYYEQENSGFLQGLAKYGQVIPFKNRKGIYGLQVSSLPYDKAIIAANSQCLVDQVDEALKMGPVHMVIGTMLAQYISVNALHEVRKRGIPILNIAMDDRLPEHWQERKGLRLGAIGLINGVDLVLQTTREYINRYLIEGCPCLYWPFGSDSDIFHPKGEKKYEVCFVGNNYGHRNKLINRIARAGIPITCFGNGFPNGHIQAFQVAQVFGQSKIVLGIGTVGYSKRVFTLKLRDFDGPMSGSLYLTNNNPDLEEFYLFGKEIEVYSSDSDCVKKILYYLENEPERERIARAGRLRALKEHTWEKRFEKVFRLVRFL